MRKTTSPVLYTAIAIIILATVLLVAGCSATERTGSSSSSKSGSSSSTPPAAPDFTVKTLDGKTVSMSDFKGKPVVLNFAASWCGPCEIEAPVLAKGYEKYKDRVAFIGLAVKDDEDSQRYFADKHGLKFPIGMDPSGDIVYSYQKAGKVSMSGIPTTFFIDRDGNIKTFWVGPLSQSNLDQMIGMIL
ncbi:thiol-disulfide oxidoreductase ResA [bacterium BMS3Abin01]|nr:thiol-disulfide oxidoreductase ResA [bacterium BMS3Abin01]